MGGGAPYTCQRFKYFSASTRRTKAQCHPGPSIISRSPPPTVSDTPVIYSAIMSSAHDPEMDLLNSEGSLSPDENATHHSVRTAPVLSGDAAELLGSGLVPQRAVYGRILSQVIDGEEQLSVIPKLYINSNAPFSAVVCGLQVRPF